MNRTDEVTTGDYVVPIYVDVGALVDVLASIEGGFSSIEKFVSRTGQETQSAKENGFSLQSMLSFLKLDLQTNNSKKSTTNAAEELSGERYYSPGSLLNRLRRHLRENELLRRPHWDEIHPSEFVEFRGVFRPNPLTEALRSMKRILEVVRLWPQFKNAKRGEMPVGEVLKMVDALVADLESSGRRLFVIEPRNEPELRLVAPILVEHLRDPTLAELAHGDFRVTAKVVRILSDSAGESVHLFPNSGIGGAVTILDGLVEALQFGREVGMKVPERIEVEIRAPAVVVLPIGISV